MKEGIKEIIEGAAEKVNNEEEGGGGDGGSGSAGKEDTSGTGAATAGMTEGQR